jgi:hypothetical protein
MMYNFAFEADAVRDAPFPVVFVSRAAQRGVMHQVGIKNEL